jgi:P pilus assembly chaperone PapD
MASEGNILRSGLQSTRTARPGILAYSNKVGHVPPGVLFLLLIFLAAENALAGSNLLVTPTRMVFEGRDRTAQVTVVNSGDETGTYRIELVNKRMTDAGTFEDIEEQGLGDLFADKMLRYSPRQVVLEPGKSQVVRFSLRKPKDLTEGEYRSHILFKAIPKDAGTNISAAAKSDKLSIKLTPIVSISIPAIVRHGNTRATVKFASVEYQAADDKVKNPSLFVRLDREGNQSVYGDLLAEYVQTDGTSRVIGQASGLAVYTPNSSRTFRLQLDIPSDMDLRAGVVNVFYRDKPDDGGKVLAQTQLKVP